MTDTVTAPAYQPDFARQAEHLCRLGAGELAAALQVDEATIGRWLDEHAAFAQAVARGRAAADAAVTTALFRRACGFEQRLTKWLREDGKMVARPYTREVLPDRQACIFWLQHRRPDLWGHPRCAPLGARRACPERSRRASDASSGSKTQDARQESRATSVPAPISMQIAEAPPSGDPHDARQAARVPPTPAPEVNDASDAASERQAQTGDTPCASQGSASAAPWTSARSRQQQKWKRKQKRADARQRRAAIAVAAIRPLPQAAAA